MSGHIAGPEARSIVNPAMSSPPVEVFFSVKVPAVYEEAVEMVRPGWIAVSVAAVVGAAAGAALVTAKSS
jgi:hypothetical protein